MNPKSLFLVFALGGIAAAAEPPRLVLQITVDQLRGDMLPRYHERFGPGGFRRFLERGLFFSNAHYRTANTFTASGHAVLVTGADTAGHGMVANEWFDRETGRVQYCTADTRYAILGEPPKPNAGMSPANLTSTTLGDELVTASAGRSRAFAVAGKDRSSIIPGGHLGKAFWFSEATGRFVSSTYYFDALPAWVGASNAQEPWCRHRSLEWKPLGEQVERGFHPKRSGDVVIVQEQFWYLYPDPESFAAMHGSPYSYDTFVPVAFAGPAIEARTVDAPIDPAGIAPTLAMWLRLKPPSGCQAAPFPDVLLYRPK